MKVTIHPQSPEPRQWRAGVHNLGWCFAPAISGYGKSYIAWHFVVAEEHLGEWSVRLQHANEPTSRATIEHKGMRTLRDATAYARKEGWIR